MAVIAVFACIYFIYEIILSYMKSTLMLAYFYFTVNIVNLLNLVCSVLCKTLFFNLLVILSVSYDIL